MSPRKYTEARKENNKKWDAENLDRISIAVPKGKKNAIKAAAAAAGESMNQYIINAVDQRMDRDAGGPQEATGAPAGTGVSLPPETLKTAQMAAQATGEAVQDFVARAVDTQAQRDKKSLRLGINPAQRQEE